MRQTSSITLWFSTVLRRACPSFSHAPTEPCSPTPDQDHVRGQRPLEAPAFSDSWHDLADVHVYTCEWIYIYIYIIHTQHNHTHAYIQYYIHIYCKSCVLKQFGDVKIIVTSKPKTIYCAGQHGVPLWWKWPTLGTFLKKLISGEMSHISLISLKELRNKIIRRKTTSSENIWEPVG